MFGDDDDDDDGDLNEKEDMENGNDGGHHANHKTNIFLLVETEASASKEKLRQ